MKNYTTILTSLQKGVFTIELNRPEIHNAFDDRLIAELTEVFVNVKDSKEVRALVITGQGKSFCAGADMNWMRRMKEASYEENYADSYRLSEMFHHLHSLPIPTIAKVNGAAVGGGVGLVAVCDLVIAASNAVFSLSEVRLGLVPACISPYLLARIQPGILRGFFLTGKRFDATKAHEIGLVNEVVEPSRLDSTVQQLLQDILACGPRSLTMAKELLHRVPGMPMDECLSYTSRMIADLRTSEEGQEGLSSFLEKRKPKWVSIPS